MDESQSIYERQCAIMLTSAIQEFIFEDTTVQLVVPNAIAVQQWYKQQANEKPFPFWAKIWPAAIALTNFLAQNQHFILHKNVVEVAAGLGLPSVYAAAFANTVCCTDYVQEPLDFVKQSAQLNQLNNISCEVFNWNNLSETITADVLLLSDINYEPSAFNSLFNMLQFFLQKQTTVLLSTPQRLMAKPFIERLLQYCVYTEEQQIDDTAVSVYVLKQH